MTAAIVIGSLAVLAALGRWIWCQGVRKGWDDAADVAQLMGVVSYRSSWIACGKRLSDLGPISLGLTEQRFTQSFRALRTICTIALLDAEYLPVCGKERKR